MEDQNKELIIPQLLKQVSDLYKRVEELESLKRDLPTNEQLSKSMSAPFTPSAPRKMKRGKGSRPLLESEILEAQGKSRSAGEASRKLGVSYNTYKKYAKSYGIFEKLINKTALGIPKLFDPRKGKYPLDDILAGKFPDYPIYRLKDRIIRSNMKPAACEQCGFNERRITDGKIPLLLVFEDGNNKNHNIQNLKILCYNCSFTSGKLWTRCKKRYYKVLNNPDRILGASKDTKQYF
jgi:hypothetical protein